VQMQWHAKNDISASCCCRFYELTAAISLNRGVYVHLLFTICHLLVLFISKKMWLWHLFPPELVYRERMVSSACFPHWQLTVAESANEAGELLQYL